MNRLVTTILTLSTLSFSAQDAAKRTGVVDMKQKLAIKNSMAFKEKTAAAKTTVKNNPATTSLKSNASVTSFTNFSRSANIYGVVINTTKALQYNDNVNAVSFIHRKSDLYVGSPNNNTGVIVAMISSNWGSTWDSTCLYSDANNFGRYPQGAVYSAPGNTNIANAYVVGSGPCIDGSSWTGNWFASKQLGVPSSTIFNNVASQTPGAQQFFSTAGPFGPNVYSNDWPSYGFTSSDNGLVKSLGQLTDDPDAAPIEARGAVLQTGSFNAGVFSWKTDSILPPVIFKSDATRQMNSNAMMAWNDAGTTGYIVFVGSRTGATLSNKGWQPIVYKTIDAGTSWVLMPGIDFNNAAYQLVKKRLDVVPTNTTLSIPFFNPFEGIDCAVDANGKLHIGAVIASAASEHNDSLAFTNEYTTESYTWPHGPNKHPYLYDFTMDLTGTWSFMTIDSISSEAPSSVSGNPGFADNPWDDDAGKVTSDGRIQLSRTPDGKNIIYTWAESDSNFTNGGKKWNTQPNVKARMWSMDPAVPVSFSGTEINVTKPATGSNPNVASTAMFHFTSPTCGAAVITTTANSTKVTVKMPMTVTNSNPLIQGSANTHYYSTEDLSFIFTNASGFNELQKDALQFSVYPNPTSQKCIVALDLVESSNLEISLLNYLGQVVKQKNYKAQFGRNEIEMDLTALNSGIYFVNVKNGNNVATKKLIVE